MEVLGNPLGTQLIGELYDCNMNIINDLELIEQTMIKAAKVAKMEIKEVTFHRFEPQGVSGVVVVSESHLAIHTWPEFGYAALDIFTCGELTDPWQAYNFIIKELNAEEVNTMEITRGTKNLRHKNKK